MCESNVIFFGVKTTEIKYLIMSLFDLTQACIAISRFYSVFVMSSVNIRLLKSVDQRKFVVLCCGYCNRIVILFDSHLNVVHK